MIIIMQRLARLVTRVTNDDYVYMDPTDTQVKGILKDIWSRVATDLNLTLAVEQVVEWEKMILLTAENKSDVALQRMDWSMIENENHFKM